ncbi:hypothetical protein CNR22_03305 [Sphingobacteriaceae bacterium]|nr:hypothetical protein CNR22_03305 [Sphingobacteriaceae bacterium]
MLNKQALHTLLDLDLPHGFSEVLIYAEQLTTRLTYACDFIFKHSLRVNFKVTSDSDFFKASKAVRINYSSTEISGVFKVLPNGLLQQKMVSEKRPLPFIKKGLLYFYESEENQDLNYDIFSSVFYFISRYEEWQTFEKDKHKRFEAKASILYSGKFHLKPVVDLWIKEFAECLTKFYPELKFPEKKFKVISTIDVDNLFAYKAKGAIRTIGATAKDILKLDFKNLKERLLVLSGKKNDPFDIYAEVSDFCFESRIPLIYFFLFRTGTPHDRTVDPAYGAYQPVFKILKENHALFGLHPSYESSEKEGLMKAEIKDFRLKTKEEITLSRQHYLRFDIKSTPALLLENGIEADFTMGYASEPGFRAGTSHPFYYYNFNSEKAEELLFVPFCVMDGVYTVYEDLSPLVAYEQMLQLAKEVKSVNGFFISVFHERSFSDHLYEGFGILYKNLHSTLKGL